MRDSAYFRALNKALTRISVTGSNDGYIVRNGDEAPVRVRRGRYGLQCECGQVRCAHIESLRMCGFVEDAQERSKAA
ncbi:MAG: hypothetical protein M3328_12385 [Chloroflexota bacterium]|nr:hypothetical protein [Chloroflexota bacterium]